MYSGPAAAQRSEIRDAQFYVDGEPFYVVGIGYSSLRPHQRPGVSYAQTNRRLIELDFKRIKAAHFNTLRTWDDLTPEELGMAKKHGLMVLQGIWLDPRQDFSDPNNQASSLARVQSIARQCKDFDNILGYLVMTEPSPEAVLRSGQEETLQFFRRLKRAIQEIDPRPVSMDSWLPLGFLDHNGWDFITFNTYSFSPQSVNFALGYPGYNRWLVDRFAPDRPLIVGETGGFAVSKSSHSPYGGFGGLTEYDQSVRNLEALRGTIEGHAAGAVLVNWIDAWHYPKYSDTHLDEPWSWNGIVGISSDTKKDIEGVPRRAYQDVMAYNKALIIEPKANHFYGAGQSIPIRVYSPDYIQGLDYSLNGGDWQPLEGSGHGWWHGFFKLPKTAKRRQRLAVRSLDSNGVQQSKKEISFVAEVAPEQVSIGLLETSKTTKGLQCRVKVTDGRQQPLAKRKVYYGFFFPAGWREAQGVAETDIHGEVTLNSPIIPQNLDRFLYVAAGTDSPDNIRTGDMRLFQLRER